MRLPWWGVVGIFFGSLALCWVLNRFGRLEESIPIAGGSAMCTIAVRLKWELRDRPWFWITMAIVVLIHILLIVNIPWTSRWIPSIAMAAVASADLIVIIIIIAVVQRLVEGPAPRRR
jgi:phosphatidylserine synthase